MKDTSLSRDETLAAGGRMPHPARPSAKSRLGKRRGRRRIPEAGPERFPATMAGIQARQQLKADADDPTLNPLDWALLRAKDLDG